MTTKRKSRAGYFRSLLSFLLILLILALTRALFIFVSLGAPIYDWQWYIGIICILILILLRVFRILHGFKLFIIILSILILWIVPGYFGFWRKRHLDLTDSPHLRISYWTGSGIIRTSNRILGDLNATSSTLYISIGRNEFDGEYTNSLVKGIRRIAGYNVPVYLCPRASDFVSLPVYGEWAENVRSAVQLVRRENLQNVHGIIGDVEKPYISPWGFFAPRSDELSDMISSQEKLIRYIQREHSDLEIGITAFIWLYLDDCDEDADLSGILKTTANPLQEWDFINVMTYSSFFPSSWRPYFVYLVEKVISNQLPQKRTSYLIGLIGKAGVGEPLMEPGDIVRDARIIRATGAEEVIVYQLIPAVQRYGDDFVKNIYGRVNNSIGKEVIVPFSRPVSLMVYGILLADVILALLSYKGIIVLLLLMAWMALFRFFRFAR